MELFTKSPNLPVISKAEVEVLVTLCAVFESTEMRVWKSGERRVRFSTPNTTESKVAMI
jgi:hypothetical protein